MAVTANSPTAVGTVLIAFLDPDNMCIAAENPDSISETEIFHEVVLSVGHFEI